MVLRVVSAKGEDDIDVDAVDDTDDKGCIIDMAMLVAWTCCGCCGCVSGRGVLALLLYADVCSNEDEASHWVFAVMGFTVNRGDSVPPPKKAVSPRAAAAAARAHRHCVS